MLVVVVENIEYYQLVCKGVLQEIFNVCLQVCYNGEIVLFDDIMLCKIKWVIDMLNCQGLCVVVVVMKYLLVCEGDYQWVDEFDLIFEGYIVFFDLLKEIIVLVLKVLKVSGIIVKIFIGDSELVAVKVCYEVGLDVGEVVIGSDIEMLFDDELVNFVQCIMLFVCLMLMYKECIVILLKCEGYVVGFMGDGINDVFVLCVVDIGIFVDGVVDIVCEAVDIILLEKSLMVLEEGVIEGCCIFVNMLKYIKMMVSFNFGNVFSVLVVSVFLFFLLMLLLYLFIQNLLYDVLQVVILFDNVDDE